LLLENLERFDKLAVEVLNAAIVVEVDAGELRKGRCMGLQDALAELTGVHGLFQLTRESVAIFLEFVDAVRHLLSLQVRKVRLLLELVESGVHDFIDVGHVLTLGVKGKLRKPGQLVRVRQQDTQPEVRIALGIAQCRCRLVPKPLHHFECGLHLVMHRDSRGQGVSDNAFAVGQLRDAIAVGDEKVEVIAPEDRADHRLVVLELVDGEAQNRVGLGETLNAVELKPSEPGNIQRSAEQRVEESL